MVKDVVRESILADPAMVLDDRDMIRALIGATNDVGDNVVDLRSVLLRRLEGKLDQLEVTHRDVIAAAYENLAGTNQIHRAVLAVLEPASFEALLSAVAHELPSIMALDEVKMCFEGDGVQAGELLGPKGRYRNTIVGLPKGGCAAFCGENGDISGPNVLLRKATRAGHLVYGEAAGSIGSEAILRLDLGAGRLPGLLIFGSADPNRFHSEQGTDLLTFLGSTFSLTMQRWLA